jgi:hypothetical protein
MMKNTVKLLKHSFLKKLISIDGEQNGQDFCDRYRLSKTKQKILAASAAIYALTSPV